jgi:Xaa-Pro aminopeptidase
MPEPPRSRPEVRGARALNEGARGGKQLNEARVILYERLMKAEEQIAHSRYAHGVTDESVVAAMEASDASLSEAQRREDLYLSSLSAFVEALGGRLEVRAVFPDETIVVERDG